MSGAASASPGIGGTKGRAPAAITMFLVVRTSRVPSSFAISTVQGSTMRAVPATTSTPSPAYRSTESCGSIAFTTERTRSITSAKSKSAEAERMPNSFDRLTCERNLAERMSAFEGTQPVFRQSPPMRWRSTSVTFALTAAAM